MYVCMYEIVNSKIAKRKGNRGTEAAFRAEGLVQHEMTNIPSPSVFPKNDSF